MRAAAEKEAVERVAGAMGAVAREAAARVPAARVAGAREEVMTVGAMAEVGDGGGSRQACALPKHEQSHEAAHTLLSHGPRSSSPPLRTLPLMRFRMSSCQADTCTSLSLVTPNRGGRDGLYLPTLAGKVRSPGSVASAFRGVIHTLLEGPPGGHAGRVGEAFEEDGLLDAAARGHSSSRAAVRAVVVVRRRRMHGWSIRVVRRRGHSCRALPCPGRPAVPGGGV